MSPPNQKATNVVKHSLLHKAKPINILAVEDDGFSMSFLKAQVADLGHTMLQAENGEDALATLKARHADIDVVLMDREMPVMDGLAAVKRMKEDQKLRNIPVIMVTGASSTEEMQEGLEAGVFYYLTKPVKEEMLRSVLSAAVREAEQNRTLNEELGKHRASFNLIETCKFQFQTLSEAESLAAFIANCFPQPERVLPGLGELLINAVEHGNLGIGYETKTGLVESGIWRSEIERLQQQPHHREKKAEAIITHKTDGTYVIITDQGDGFNWRKYMSIDPARAGDNHGRGIAQAAATSFDKLTFNDKGNQAIGFVGKGGQLDW